jgi:hypothetical protein
MEISGMGSNQFLKILVDTNILLYVYDRFDPFERVVQFLDYKPTFYLTKSVLKELRKLAEVGGPLMQMKVQVALKYLDAYRNYWSEIDEEDNNIDVDTHLLKVSKKYDMAIFTNDLSLRRRALKMGIKVLYLRQKSKNISLSFII